MSYFKNKVVWITGASSGIGEAIAIEANRAGATLILSARRPSELERVKNALPNPSLLCICIQVDMTNYNCFASAIETAITQTGTIDILINNAGISQRSFAIDTTFEDEQKLFSTNVIGLIGFTKQIIPLFLTKKSGQIVVISSTMGKIYTPYRSAYAASKHALMGYFNCLRLELPSYITISIILPGYINTPIVDNAIGGKGIVDSANAKGISATIFAIKALQAIALQKKEIYIGGIRERLAIALCTYFPSIYNRIINHQKVV